jgi:hypothetical protein
LSSRRSRSRKGRKTGRAGEKFGQHTHGKLPPLDKLEPFKG